MCPSRTLTSCWKSGFPMKTFLTCAAGFAEPEAEKEIREDEEKLFDRTHMPSFTVVECESR